MFLAALIYVICGVLDYGLSFAYLQREYPELAKLDYVEDRIFSFIGAIFGPVGLITTTIVLGLDGTWFKHGLKFK